MMRVTVRSVVASCVLLCAGLTALSAPAVAAERQQRNQITISSDDAFVSENGVRSGSGTRRDPYVISGWQVSRIHINDTSKHFVIRDNEISGQLTLNWTGDRVTVIDNSIGDLRVNQNVKRVGGPTSGRIAHNEIQQVGQLRHFDGIFELNTVGAPSTMELPFFDTRSVNFDGFNGARFRNNTIYGYMDVKLHGHHHGSGYSKSSHDHSAPDAHAHDGHMDDTVDHTQRFHEVWVTGNTIYSSSYYALGFNDQGHAGNDRTAASEQNEALNRPHVHHTRVHLNNNHLIGSGLEVAIFNAQDELHTEYAIGMLEIRDNTIEISRSDTDLFQRRDGIAIWDARHVDLRVIGNKISGTFDGQGILEQDTSDAGISVDRLHMSRMLVANNSIASMGVGVSAYRFTESEWVIKRLSTEQVGERFRHDDSAKPGE